MAVNPKCLAGQKKPQLALVPATAVEQCARAFEDGARKYGPYNWREISVRYMVYINAALRHMRALVDREDTASDSGVHHAASAMASMAIILDALEHDCLEDDRPYQPMLDRGADRKTGWYPNAAEPKAPVGQDFQWALTMMLDGKCVRRREWLPWVHVYIPRGYIVIRSSPRGTDWLGSVPSFQATDWELLA